MRRISFSAIPAFHAVVVPDYAMDDVSNIA
jgi:hypothetical protein